ncbi:hypothetical protein GCM10010390_38770 [Streptomyces mordarskii]|uniref:Uncharacterized protein n=1 Tax=Streptomyces mordarskii TaxID=1226758 RepID=A0ABN1D2Y9_9ACTN
MCWLIPCVGLRDGPLLTAPDGEVPSWRDSYGEPSSTIVLQVRGGAVRSEPFGPFPGYGR